MKHAYKPIVIIVVVVFLLLTVFAVLRRSHIPSVPVACRTNDAADELQSELQKIKAAGQPLTVREVLGKELPDSRNATILYQEAFSKLSISKADQQTLMDLFAYIGRSDMGQAPSPASLEAIVAANAEAIALLEAAARLPECRFPVDWSAGTEVAFPAHHTKLLECARLLGAKAILHSWRHEMHRVLDTVRTSLALGEAAGTDPTVQGQLARYGLHAITLRALQSSISEQTVSPKDCKALFESLRRLEFIDAFARALKGERAMGIQWFDNAREDMRAGQDAQNYDLDRDEAAYLQVMSEWIGDAAKPRRGTNDLTGAYQARVERLPQYCVMSRILLTPLCYAPRKRDETVARVGLAETSLALKVYKHTEHKYPKSLKQLRQMVAWQLRKDPFSGEDFVYRPEGDGFLLYSVGPNQRDDGGEPLGAKPGIDDIVWHCAR